MSETLWRECAGRLRRARETGSTWPLVEGSALPAAEAELLDRLGGNEAGGTDDVAPAAVRRLYGCVRSALSLLVEGADAEVARSANRRLNRLERLARARVLRSYPLRAYVETTNRCNLRCLMCGQRFHQGPRSSLPAEAVARLAAGLRFCDEVNLYGYGEPLLVPHLDRMLDMIPPGARSRLVSNGVLLDRRTGRMLVDRGLKALVVSLDAAEPGTHRRLRRVDAFTDIVDHVRDLVAYRDERGLRHPDVGLSFVAMRSNVEQLPGFVALAHSLGASTVYVDYLTVYSEDLRQESLFYDQALADRCLDLAAAVAGRLGVNFAPPVKFSSPQERAALFPRCAEPWEFVYFRTDGSLQPCCTAPVEVARWTDGAFADYWNSPGLRHLRRTIHTPDQPQWCRDCTHLRFRDVRREGSHIHILEESRRDLPTSDNEGRPLPSFDAGAKGEARPRADEPGPAAGDCEGFLDSCAGGSLWGWVWCPGRPQQRLPVSVWVDGRLVAVRTASEPRPDVAGTGRGDGRYGFSLALPPEVLLGAEVVRVRVGHSGLDLTNSPWRLPR